MKFPRWSGILLHITSLPGRFGIGDLGPSAYEFADFLSSAGQTLWQVLPLNATGYGESPYQCFSAFADPDNRRDFPGGFPGDTRNAFSSVGRTPEEQDVFSYVQSLLALRQKHAALRTGKQWHIGWDDSYYAFLRELPEEKLLVVYNNASSARDLQIPLVDTPLENANELRLLFGNVKADLSGGDLHKAQSGQSIAVLAVR